MIACTLRLLRMKILALNCANMNRHELTRHVVTSLLMLTFEQVCEMEISLGHLDLVLFRVGSNTNQCADAHPSYAEKTTIIRRPMDSALTSNTQRENDNFDVINSVL